MGIVWKGLVRYLIPGLRRSPRGAWRGFKYLLGLALLWVGFVMVLGAIGLTLQAYLPIVFSGDTARLLDIGILLGSLLKFLPGFVLMSLGSKIGKA